MKNLLLLILTLSSLSIAKAQSTPDTKDSGWTKLFRGSYPRINDLVHTKLEVKFDYAKAYMYGKEWLTLKPHFYATDSLLLDAKGMDIKEISMVNGAKKSPLKYKYDNLQLRITLDKSYSKNEKYTIYIDYTSKPNELKVKGSAAINDAKGLYFINPLGTEKNKHTEIWTQGETESNSAWMPTIDKPNQKSTEEIYMTVPAKYVTLSNGLLVSQKKNADGTRTDYWRMYLPHAPYLFFMSVGDYTIVKDQYKGKEVSYYVEKEYAPYARKIFGNTPEMIKFFEQKLGVEFAWPKYSQIVSRDYVSGAMENTTATNHASDAYQNARELVDKNRWEGTIAHELFHQWFGDLVTAESWSNLTVNESMADFSQTLWMEYKYGKDAGDEENQTGLSAYLANPEDAAKNLVRFKYADREDMFDEVSYQKGGRVLQMLRNYVGEEAFFQSLNLYLTTNKFKTGEADQMRLAFEEVTGQDLNWFWDQWYFGNGHPELKISYSYNETAKNVKVIVEQMQDSEKVFKLPVSIDIYESGVKKRHQIWIENRVDTLTFSYSKRPDLVNFDADKIILGTKLDKKTTENFVYQIKHAPLYMDRKEALEYFSETGMKELAIGLNDKFAGLRKITINNLDTSRLANDPAIIQSIVEIAKNDKDKVTKAAAIEFLVHSEDPIYQKLYEENINDSSYTVAAAALQGLTILQPERAYNLAKKLSSDAKGELTAAIIDAVAREGNEADFDMINSQYSSLLNWEKVLKSLNFSAFLEKVKDPLTVKKGIDEIFKSRNAVPKQYWIYTERIFKTGLETLGRAKGQEISDYVAQGFK